MLRALILALFLTLPSAPAVAETMSQLRVTTLAGDTHTFQVVVARTAAQQQRGLMFVRDLPPMTGMVFPMAPPREARFWMRNTLVPLDMIFIAPGGMIVKIATRRDTQSDMMTRSGQPVSAVFEINAGEAARLGIGVGDRVAHDAVAF